MELVKAAYIDMMTTIFRSLIVGMGIGRRIRKKGEIVGTINLIRMFCNE